MTGFLQRHGGDASDPAVVGYVQGLLSSAASSGDMEVGCDVARRSRMGGVCGPATCGAWNSMVVFCTREYGTDGERREERTAESPGYSGEERALQPIGIN